MLFLFDSFPDCIQTSAAAVMLKNPSFYNDIAGFQKEFDEFCNGKFAKNMAYFLNALKRDVIMDNDPEGIHFLNGRFDLRSGTFIPLHSPQPFGRTDQLFITKVLPYEWRPLNELAKVWLETKMIEIFGDRYLAEYMVYTYARALTGTAVKDCDMLINIGLGGSGKSTVFNMMSSSLGFYVQSMKFTVFNDNHEFQMCFRDLPKYVKMVFVEECDKIKTISNLKTLCDGQIEMRKKGTNVKETLLLSTKVFTTTNNFIYFGEDTGTLRRIYYLNYSSKFIKPIDGEAQPEQRIFHRDDTLSPQAIRDWNDEFKSNFFNVIANYAPYAFATKVPQIPTCLYRADTLYCLTVFAREAFVPSPGVHILKADLLEAVKIYFAKARITFKDAEIVNGLREECIFLSSGKVLDTDFSPAYKADPSYETITSRVVRDASSNLRGRFARARP